MPRLIKRYDNRKLYDTEAKRYVSLRDLAGMVRDGEEVLVTDNASGADLTSQTLAKIIVEEETGERLEPQFLHGLLRWGGRKTVSGVEQLQKGVDRLVQASVERLFPVREMRAEVGELRERLRRLEEIIRKLEASHDEHGTRG
jgi:polyhydroxyalkanoate synthesis repressor PhaR